MRRVGDHRSIYEMGDALPEAELRICHRLAASDIHRATQQTQYLDHRGYRSFVIS